MTTAIQLGHELATLGVSLEADSDRLRFHPRERVSDELLARMKELKIDLLRLLTTTIRCPSCQSRFLVDGPRGLWCLDCERLAWVATSDGGAVRADFEQQIVIDS